MLRRTSGETATETIRVGDLVIDLPHRRVERNGDPNRADHLRIRAAEALAANPGRVFTRGQLLDSCGACTFESYERSIDAHIKNLRKKLEPDPRRPGTCSPSTASATSSPMPDYEHAGPTAGRDGRPAGMGAGVRVPLIFGSSSSYCWSLICAQVAASRFGGSRPAHRVGGHRDRWWWWSMDRLFARRMFGRTWAPVGDLIDATRRLGEGETGVRIPTSGPGPFGAVGASFNRMAVRLEEEDERRRRLLADLGHELRTPLTVIRGEIEAVLDGLHEPESRPTSSTRWS